MKPRCSLQINPLRFRRLQSTKPFYVTTPIFYVNAAPHIGHLYSMLMADARSRWEQMHPSRSAFMLTGTDEHGLKIQTAAKKQGLEPKALVDQVAQNFKELCSSANISYDRFMRTSDEDHVRLTQYFWRLMREKGYIYKGSHSGWYCVSDETFYPESSTEEIEKDGKTIRISTESKHEVTYGTETNYFFKLSQFQQQLIDYLEQNPEFIKPRHRYEFILNELTRSKLEDLSISRPASRLQWSIEVPDDPSQKIYVWFDALLNYLTAANFPHGFTTPNTTNYNFTTPTENIWPATHIIGKDIIRFHCIYWPIFLIAAGVELPREVIVHSHWLSSGSKMSKSLGNVVHPADILQYYGTDPVRFFFIENSNIREDCKFSDELLHASRVQLLNKYFNLAMRVTSPNFNIADAVRYHHHHHHHRSNELQEEHPEQLAELITSFQTKIDALYATMDDRFQQFDYSKAIQSWWEVVSLANQIFQMGEPWKYARALQQENSQDLDSVKREMYTRLSLRYVYVAAEALRVASILIQPVMPSLASQVLDLLKVRENKRTCEFARLGADESYGEGANDESPRPLLSKLKVRQVAAS
ncbi:uncharacterized protein LODBEIA_P54410 [Lodderomyces beijingensis]|uniref:methionine--tRNA ligase n=1 Tax=Lodderomyces beijingensis TaxID=1775926 RepID=A0ABP0ZSW7_9ASCO